MTFQEQVQAYMRALPPPIKQTLKIGPYDTIVEWCIDTSSLIPGGFWCHYSKGDSLQHDVRYYLCDLEKWRKFNLNDEEYVDDLMEAMLELPWDEWMQTHQRLVEKNLRQRSTNTQEGATA